MSNDISNRAILVLVILTVIVSTLGTLTVLESVSKVDNRPVPIGQTTVQSGQINLELASPPPTGQVTLKLNLEGEE